jgi:integrase
VLKKIKVKQDINKKKSNKAYFVVDLRSVKGSRKYFWTNKEAQNFLDYVMQNHKKQTEDLDNWTIKELLGSFPDKDLRFEWDRRLANNDPLRTFYFREYRNMKTGKPLPDYFDKYKSQFDTILSIRVGNKTVGQLKPRELTVEHCETYILPKLFNSGRKGKRSYKTVKEMRSCFNKLMAFGKSRNCVEQNPMLDAEFKKPVSDKPIEIEKLSTNFIHEIDKHLPNSIRLAFRFACGTGLRTGEQRALTWEDINFDMSEVSVRKSAKLKIIVNGEVEMHGLGAVKTTTSNRVVPIPANIIIELKELFIKQGRPTVTNFVFGTKYNTMVVRTYWREQLQKVVKNISDKHMRWHDLRHYYASKMLEYYGNDLWTVSNLMGHSDISITQRTYGHWMLDKARREKLRNDMNKIKF